MYRASEKQILSTREITFVLPRGSGHPIENIGNLKRFLIFDDSQVGREMMDLEGPGGPDSFDVDVGQVLAGANKVIVAVGGPSETVRLLMNSAARPKGYSAVVDTCADRFAGWADKVVSAREGEQGLFLVGPRYRLPPNLRERCVLDTQHPPWGLTSLH